MHVEDDVKIFTCPEGRNELLELISPSEIQTSLCATPHTLVTRKNK